ncbi:MAG: hypothetical protein L0Z62_34930, partial [Gemmataceae bacterium]|nr:hypothetical protein [Gemmataceae bacterium]
MIRMFFLVVWLGAALLAQEVDNSVMPASPDALAEERGKGLPAFPGTGVGTQHDWGTARAPVYAARSGGRGASVGRWMKRILIPAA